jgi:hypothetical protein
MKNANLKMENDKLKYKMNNNFFILHCAKQRGCHATFRCHFDFCILIFDLFSLKPVLYRFGDMFRPDIF